MQKPRPWIVTRHDPIEKLEANLWAVNGDIPGFPTAARFERRMQIVRLPDGRLVFHNAVALEEGALAEVRSWGRPAILIVPHHLHATDAHAFREKLGVRVYTSRTVLERVRAIVAVDGTLEDLPNDPVLRREPLGGTKFGEAAYVVQSATHASLILCDAIMNSRAGKGPFSLVLRLLGFAGQEPRVAVGYKLRAVSDKNALKRDLLRLAQIPNLVRLVPSHGEIVAHDAAGALRRAAERA
jgi:hypothetical protein